MSTTALLNELSRYELRSLLVRKGEKLSRFQVLARKKILERVGDVKEAQRLAVLLARLSDGPVRWRIDPAECKPAGKIFTRRDDA